MFRMMARLSFTILLVPTATFAAESPAALYEATCVACHGSDGKGTLPGVPDLTGNRGPLSKSDADLTMSIANGVRSPKAPMSMPAKGGNDDLEMEQIPALLRYMRSKFVGP